MPSVVDLFCGVGGLTHGFIKEGFTVVAGIDVDPTCKYAYETNNNARFILKDVRDLTSEEIVGLYPEGDTRILVGCTPCQPFSRYANRKGQDDKWQLVGTFAELISAVRPEIVSMENVPQMEKHPVFTDFIQALATEGYYTWYSVVNCLDYGIPQTRKRLVLLASRLGQIEMVRRTHPPGRHRTVAQTIRCLERLAAGEASRKDPIHRASALSELNLRRIKATPPGGAWRDWDEGLQLDCHKKETGKTYPSIYGRMKWDEPSPTITCQCHGLGNGRFGHPEQDRAISLREAALLQAFPKSYIFVETKSQVVISNLARHIGNAVPVRLGRIIARSITRHLEEHRGQ